MHLDLSLDGAGQSTLSSTQQRIIARVKSVDLLRQEQEDHDQSQSQVSHDPFSSSPYSAFPFENMEAWSEELTFLQQTTELAPFIARFETLVWLLFPRNFELNMSVASIFRKSLNPRIREELEQLGPAAHDLRYNELKQEAMRIDIEHMRADRMELDTDDEHEHGSVSGQQQRHRRIENYDKNLDYDGRITMDDGAAPRPFSASPGTGPALNPASAPAPNDSKHHTPRPGFSAGSKLSRPPRRKKAKTRGLSYPRDVPAHPRPPTGSHKRDVFFTIGYCGRLGQRCPELLSQISEIYPQQTFQLYNVLKLCTPAPKEGVTADKADKSDKSEILRGTGKSIIAFSKPTPNFSWRLANYTSSEPKQGTAAPSFSLPSTVRVREKECANKEVCKSKHEGGLERCPFVRKIS